LGIHGRKEPLIALAVEGPSQLRSAAEAYALQWMFDPTTLEGKPVIARFRFITPFRLRKRTGSLGFMQFQEWTLRTAREASGEGDILRVLVMRGVIDVPEREGGPSFYMDVKSDIMLKAALLEFRKGLGRGETA
jgi:hypothetical protein